MSHAGRSSLPVAAWLGAVLAACSLSLMGVAALAPRIAADTGLSREAVGLFSGLVWSSALLASLATGALVQRVGPWAVARFALAGCALGLVAIAAGEPALFWGAAVCIGIGHGFEAPPASQLLGHHVPTERRPFYFSLKQTGVQVGAVTASLLLPALALWGGWRAAVLGVAGLLALLALALAGPSRRHAMPVAAPPAGAGAAHPLLSWVSVLRGRADLQRLALAAAAFGATQVCMNTFLVTWMVAVRDVPLTTAGALAATAQGAGLVGRPLWGWVASRSGGAIRVLRGLGALMAVCALALGLTGASLPGPALALLAAAFGLSASGWNGVFLSEVATRSGGEGIAAATAAAMVPMYLGLVAGPVAFAAISRGLDLSAGFVVLSAAAAVGALLVPAARR
ncbi:MFS transporter [Ramlibacter sp. MAHUQ-53]|uniref:MFS transporter n=1 Tax=unclassified Ramlibacter TaxID=2617605 RepID=UPI00363DF5D7